MRKLLALLLLFPLPVLASETAQVYPPDGVLSFRGLDEATSILTIEDGRATSLQNVKLTRSLNLKKRDGYKTIGGRINFLEGSDYFSSIQGLYYTKLSDGTEYRIALSGGKTYYDVAGTWTNIRPRLTSGKNYQSVFVTALDKIVWTNDEDVVRVWTGTGKNTAFAFTGLSDAVTKVKALAWFKNYFVIANTVEDGTERPTRIRWSNVGTVNTWSDDDYIDIAALGGQEINAIVSLYDNLFFLLTDEIWKATLVGGDDIYVLSKVVDDIGCIAKNSVQTVNLLNQRKGIMFLSKDKRVYFFDGINITDLSHIIPTTMNALNEDRLQYAVSAEDGDSYYLSVSTGSSSTTNNLLLEFQYEIGEWTKHTIDANAMAKVIDTNNLSKIYFGNYDSVVFQLADTSLDSDVIGRTDGISGTGLVDLSDGTATGLTILLTDTLVDYSATGATVTITTGPGANEEKVVVEQTASGLIVDSAFTTEPTGDSSISLGDIDAYYKTKWFDLGDPVRRKLMGQVYVWGETDSSVTINMKEALDFNDDLRTEVIDLQSSGGAWDDATWDTDVWGGGIAKLNIVKMSDTGRYLRLTFEDADINEGFLLYNYAILFWGQDFQ